MAKTTHRATVFVIEELRNHKNATSLELVRFHNYVCVVQKGAFRVGERAVFIPPDSLVPVTRPEFSFLAPRAYEAGHRYEGFCRITAMKLRGVLSQGLVIPYAGPGQPGDDVAEELGIRHYEPPEPESRGPLRKEESYAAGPRCTVPVYDLENWFVYADAIEVGEPVIVTEKIHGSNVRVLWDGETLHVGTRRHWVVETANLPYWRALTEEVREVIKGHPWRVFYGEVFGDVQDLRYGCGRGEVRVAFFDVFDLARLKWLAPDERVNEIARWFTVPKVPVISRIRYTPEALRRLIDGPSLVPGAGHIREGIVVEPLRPRWHEKIGRVKLKAVSGEYLARRGKSLKTKGVNGGETY